MLLTGGIALADLQADRATALQELDAGNALYEKQQWQAALERYQRAYAHVPSPKIFFNYGQVYRKLGRHVDAAEAYERFLAEATDAAESHRRAAERALQELSRSLGSLEVGATVGGVTVDRVHVWVDGSSRGTVPTGKTLWVVPGAHHVVVREGNAVVEVEVVVEAGRRTSVAARWERRPDVASPTPLAAEVATSTTPNSSPASSEPPPLRPPPRSPLAPPRTDVTGAGAGRTWAWVTLGLGGASLLATGGLLLGAKARSADGDRDCDVDGCFDAGVRAKNEARSLADAATGTFVAGVALLSTSAALFLLVPARRDAGRSRITWSVGPTGFIVDARF